MLALLMQFSQDQLARQISAEPMEVQLMQLAFYGGILCLMVGLPVFIFLWIRMCRDVHQISKALWAIYWHANPPQEHPLPAPRRVQEPTGAISTSAFGR